MRYILYAYILLIPFLHALSPVPIQSAAFFLLVAISPFVMLAPARTGDGFAKQDACLFLTWLLGVLAWWFYPVSIEQDRIQGAVQWLSTIVFSLIVVRKLIVVSGARLEDVGKFASVSIIILSTAIIADFWLANLEGLNLSDVIPFSVTEFPKAEVLGVLQRPRGLTTEAGFNGIIYECLAPFSIYYALKNKGLLALISSVAMVVGILLIFSLSTIFSMVSAVAIYFLIKKKSFVTLFFVSIFIPSLIYVILTNEFLYELFGYKLAEFLDVANYNVFSIGRQGSLFYGIQLFFENVLGIGWGTILQEANIPGTAIDHSLDSASLISLWLELLVAAGIFGFALIAYVFFRNIKGLAERGGEAGSFVFVSLTAVTLHHIFVYDLWFPMIWFSLAVAQVSLSAGYGAYFLSSGATRRV